MCLGLAMSGYLPEHHYHAKLNFVASQKECITG